MKVSTFRHVLKDLGWPGLSNKEETRLVFGSLDLQGMGMITREDLAWLDLWQPAEWVWSEEDPAEWEKLKAQLVDMPKRPDTAPESPSHQAGPLLLGGDR